MTSSGIRTWSVYQWQLNSSRGAQYEIILEIIYKSKLIIDDNWLLYDGTSSLFSGPCHYQTVCVLYLVLYDLIQYSSINPDRNLMVDIDNLMIDVHYPMAPDHYLLAYKTIWQPITIQKHIIINKVVPAHYPMTLVHFLISLNC